MDKFIFNDKTMLLSDAAYYNVTQQNTKHKLKLNNTLFALNKQSFRKQKLL